jgi:molecular chaperone GrpE
MQEPLEGLDATAEAETDMAEVAPAQPTPDLDSMRRALRDLEAAKARVERDARRVADEMREKLALELLPVLDNLDRTVRAAENVAGANVPACAATLQGVRQVRSQFAAVLGKFGIEQIDARHQPFDPRIHDAISVVPVNHPSAHDVVIDQIEPGYRFGERLLRPAKVIVGRMLRQLH